MSSGFNLTSSHVFAMMSLCSYEFAALGGSRFCSLFTEQEWEDYEYAADLQFYGGYGFGAPSGRAQGIGYVVELGARLEGRLVHKGDVGINYTYDNTEASFPLHQPVYMDMAHDTTIISVLTALGLNTFKEPNGLSAAVEHSPPHRFRVSEITPFGARLIFEVWTCQNDTNFNDLSPVLYTNPDLSSAQNTSNYIRLVLNGAPVSLDGLSGCLRAVNGFCRLGSFLGDIPKLKEQAQYDFACGGNYTRGKQVADGTPEEEL
jgi:3-phytase